MTHFRLTLLTVRLMKQHSLLVDLIASSPQPRALVSILQLIQVSIISTQEDASLRRAHCCGHHDIIRGCPEMLKVHKLHLSIAVGIPTQVNSHKSNLNQQFSYSKHTLLICLTRYCCIWPLFAGGGINSLMLQFVQSLEYPVPDMKQR